MVTRVRLRRVLGRLLRRGVRLLQGGRAAVSAGMGDGETGRRRGRGHGGGGRDRTCGAIRTSATAGASAATRGPAGTRGATAAVSASVGTYVRRATAAAAAAATAAAPVATARCRGDGGTERGIRGVLARVRDRGALAAGGRRIEEGIRQIAHA